MGIRMMNLSMTPMGSGAVWVQTPSVSKALLSTLQPWAFFICHSQGIHTDSDNGSTQVCQGR